MKQTEAKNRIEKLRREIEEHNNNYYVLNKPVISDFEYDLLINELDTLEKRFPEFISADSQYKQTHPHKKVSVPQFLESDNACTSSLSDHSKT